MRKSSETCKSIFFNGSESNFKLQAIFWNLWEAFRDVNRKQPTDLPYWRIITTGNGIVDKTVSESWRDLICCENQMNDSRRLLWYWILPMVGYLSVKLFFDARLETRKKSILNACPKWKKKWKLSILRNSEVCSSSLLFLCIIKGSKLRSSYLKLRIERIWLDVVVAWKISWHYCEIATRL